MSSDVAISVRGIGKTFQVTSTQARATTLGEVISQKIRRPFSRQERGKKFDALRDISFEVNRGEVLGIVGHNGAGKSTLLKILSQITPPTTGAIDLQGRVGSLLEVGTGFHPELTGRENIYLNGTILGMSRREIDREFENIVAFAETEEFLDVPVKRYSSGMYVRLAFAVAAHLKPDILIVDEVLAVGDVAFQRKCLGKMDEVASREGRTVLFVSHQMAAVQQLCSSCILLEKGRIGARGTASEMTALYLDSAGSPAARKDEEGAEYRLEVSATSSGGEPTRMWRYGTTLCIQVVVSSRKPMWKPAVDLAFYDPFRRRLFAIQSDRLSGSPNQCEGSWTFRCEVDNPGFTVSELLIDAGLREGVGEYLALQVEALRLPTDVSSLPEGASTDGLIYPRLKHSWERQS